jgi:hypothetical protein
MRSRIHDQFFDAVEDMLSSGMRHVGHAPHHRSRQLDGLALERENLLDDTSAPHPGKLSSCSVEPVGAASMMITS